MGQEVVGSCEVQRPPGKAHLNRPRVPCFQVVWSIDRDRHPEIFGDVSACQESYSRVERWVPVGRWALVELYFHWTAAENVEVGWIVAVGSIFLELDLGLEGRRAFDDLETVVEIPVDTAFRLVRIFAG